MIQKIYRSKFDIENLSRLRTCISSDIDTFNYKGIVVNKPWGYEYLIFENAYVAIWVLFLKYNHGTSMHCHPTKKTSLLVLSGKVNCSTLDGWIERKEGEGLLIDEAVFHSSKAISKSGALIMEVESPPNKKDLVRLKDGYGREKQGYEGMDKMSQEFEKYDYFDFHNEDFKKRCTKELKKFSISIFSHMNPEDINKLLAEEKGHIICILQGKLHDANGNVLLSTGESEVLENLLKTKAVAFGDITCLTIEYKNKK